MLCALLRIRVQQLQTNVGKLGKLHVDDLKAPNDRSAEILGVQSAGLLTSAWHILVVFLHWGGRC